MQRGMKLYHIQVWSQLANQNPRSGTKLFRLRKYRPTREWRGNLPQGSCVADHTKVIVSYRYFIVSQELILSHTEGQVGVPAGAFEARVGKGEIARQFRWISQEQS